MIAIIDVSGANLTSLGNALKQLKFDYVLTHNPQEIAGATHVILPGVGTAKYGMQALKKHGLVAIINELTQPLLGICLGMQLLFTASEEGDIECLGLIQGLVQKLRQEEDYPVPHMGWNQLDWCQASPLQQGLKKEDYFYFVHSYAVPSTPYAVADCVYKEPFTAIVQKNNIYGMQFHPEKSAETGMLLLKNFLELRSV